MLKSSANIKKVPSSMAKGTQGSTAFEEVVRGKEPVPSLVNHYRGHRGPILSLAFHPTLQTLFSSGEDNFIMGWNFKKETRALRFEGHTGPVNDISFSQYGDLLLSASDDCTVRVWVPIITGHYLSMKGHSGPVRSCSFHPSDDSIFATGSNDKTVKIWSVQAAKTKSGSTKFKSHDFLASYKGHKNWVRSVRFSPDGNLLCSSSDDKTVHIIDPRSGTNVAILNCSVGSPLKAEFNPCGNTYVGVSTTNSGFLMFDMREKRLVQSYNLLDTSTNINDVSFHPSGDFALCVGDAPSIKILDLIEGRPIFTLFGPRKAVIAATFNREGNLFATAGKDEEVLIWEPTLLPYVPEQEDSKSEHSNASN